jgi:hypothetical protein
MEQATQETQATPETQAIPGADKLKKKSNIFYFAVLQELSSGDHSVVQEKQRRDLTKLVASRSGWKVVASFKGKQMIVEEKTTVCFN